MKEGTIISFKLCCFLIIPACSAFISLLKPRARDGVWPNGIEWTVTAIIAIANVANAGLAFSSGSFAKWQEKQNGNTSTTTTASTTTTTVPPAPAPPTPTALANSPAVAAPGAGATPTKE